jgi:hypothetical protein
MEALSPSEFAAPAAPVPAAACWPCPPPPGVWLEPFTPTDLQLMLRGDVEADDCEIALAQVARSRGALDVAVGEGLAAIAVGDRLARLGYSCLGDYAREVLGIQERTAEAMARLSRELRSRPLLRAAVCAGEVRPRHAQAVLLLARGEAEAGWVERAKVMTVRALEAAVRAERPGAVEEPEAWATLHARLAPEERLELEAALELAGQVLGPGSGRPARLDAVAAEYLGSHPDPWPEPTVLDHAPPDRCRAALRAQQEAHLEAETEGWWMLRGTVPVRVPEEGLEELSTARAIDGWVRRLAELRASWDDLLGNLARGLQASGLFRVLGFASLAHYARERLGLSARTVEQRAALERRLWEAPALREAKEAGLSYERLRLLSRLPDGEIAAWALRARELTCIALRRALETGQEAQLCAARAFTARVPWSTGSLLGAAFRAARRAEGRMLSDGECLLVLARHFTATWLGSFGRRQSRSQRVRARDLGRCQMPGCSRAATHAHHIIPRSRGGSDDPSNLVSVCTVHHLRGIHAGNLRIRGLAPDRLAWEVVLA